MTLVQRLREALEETDSDACAAKAQDLLREAADALEARTPQITGRRVVSRPDSVFEVTRLTTLDSYKRSLEDAIRRSRQS